MWVLVFFDLPTDTKKERKVAAKFRKDLLGDGFSMFQFSIYIRHCASFENAKVHICKKQIYFPHFSEKRVSPLFGSLMGRQWA